MRVIKVTKDKIELKDNVEVIFEKKITKFGTCAKIDCPKAHIGKKAYVIVTQEALIMQQSSCRI